jgi:hypothetical protein
MILDANRGDYKYIVKDANGLFVENLIWCNTDTGEVMQEPPLRNPDDPRLSLVRRYLPAPLQVFLNDRRVF